MSAYVCHTFVRQPASVHWLMYRKIMKIVWNVKETHEIFVLFLRKYGFRGVPIVYNVEKGTKMGAFVNIWGLKQGAFEKNGG